MSIKQIHNWFREINVDDDPFENRHLDYDYMKEIDDMRKDVTMTFYVLLC